jgi:hypothetical protein
MNSSTVIIRLGWLAVTLVLGIFRLLGTMDNRFQAIAHVTVGGFFGAWFIGKSIGRRESLDADVSYYLFLGIGLTLLETIAFLAGIGRIDGR